MSQYVLLLVPLLSGCCQTRFVKGSGKVGNLAWHGGKVPRHTRSPVRRQEEETGFENSDILNVANILHDID